MALDFSEGFESGSNGATITSGNTNFNNGVIGTTATFDSSTFAHGTLGAKLVTSANTCVLSRTFASGNQRTMRRYVKILALPASGNLILHTVKLGAAAATATMRVTNAGQIQIRDGTTTVATSTTTVAANAWFRYEWQVDGVGTSQNLQLFVGANFDGVSADQTITGTYSGGSFDTSNSGPNTSGSYTVWLDDAAEDNSITTIGSAAPPTGSIFSFAHVVRIGT